ncbi:hypothetical protein AB3N60_15965 [Leptospira sp. WS39.C2]
MKLILMIIPTLFLSHCLYHLTFINKVDKTENKWTVEEKKKTNKK